MQLGGLCGLVSRKHIQWPQDMPPGAMGVEGGTFYMAWTGRQQGCSSPLPWHMSHYPPLWGSESMPPLRHQGRLPTSLREKRWASIPDLPDSRLSEGSKLTSSRKMGMVGFLPRLFEFAVPGKWWSLLSGILPHWSGETKGPLHFLHPHPEPLVPMWLAVSCSEDALFYCL